VAYTQTTFDSLVTTLAGRLADTTERFWTDEELRAYIIEAIRTWQAYSAYYTTQLTIATTPFTLFYDLFAEPELTPSITDRDIISMVLRHLQEPVDPTGASMTAQFAFPAIVDSLKKRRDQFLLETGLVQKTLVTPGPVLFTANGQVELDNDVISVRRAVWVNTSDITWDADNDTWDFSVGTWDQPRPGTNTLLWKIDRLSMTSGDPAWRVAIPVPTDWTTLLMKPLMFQVMPPPSLAGTLQLIIVQSDGALDPANVATILGIPDDLCWVIKFGVLADVYGQDGPGQDLERAGYCNSRWKDGIQLARITNYARFGQIDDSPAFIDSLPELDSSDVDWMNKTQAVPDGLAISGNLLACVPPSTAQANDLHVDAVVNVPVPSAGGDFIQVGQEYLDAILNYAQHLCLLKEGGEGFKSVQFLYQDMVRLAAVQNDALKANANNFEVLSDREQRDKQENPRRESDIDQKELSYKGDELG